jgi:hypothetical protein
MERSGERGCYGAARRARYLVLSLHVPSSRRPLVFSDKDALVAGVIAEQHSGLSATPGRAAVKQFAAVIVVVELLGATPSCDPIDQRSLQ